MKIDQLVKLIAFAHRLPTPFEPFAQTAGRGEAKESSMAVGIVLRCAKPASIGNGTRSLRPRKLSRAVIDKAQFHERVEDRVVHKP